MSVCVVLPLHHRREPGFQAYDPPTLEMLSLLIMLKFQLRKNKYMVLLVLDGATNLLWATAQNSLNNKETIQALRLGVMKHNCMPKGRCR